MSLYYVSSVYVGAPCTGVPYYAIATKSPYADCRYYNSLPSYKNCTTTIGNPDPLSRSYGIIDCISADSVDKLFRKLAPGTDFAIYETSPVPGCKGSEDANSNAFIPLNACQAAVGGFSMRWSANTTHYNQDLFFNQNCSSLATHSNPVAPLNTCFSEAQNRSAKVTVFSASESIATPTPTPTPISAAATSYSWGIALAFTLAQLL